MENRNSKNNKTRQEKVNKIQSKTNNETNKKTTHESKNQTILVPQEQNEKKIQRKELNNTSSTKQNKSKSKQNIIACCIILGITFLVALLGKLLGGKMVEGRTNPPAYPPDWVFSVAWAILYVLIAIATCLVYKNTADKKERTCRMIWYAVHLFFNLFWPLFYFRLDMLIVSCFILLSMVITAIVLTFKYFKNNLISGTLFTIYSLWLLYAMYLNLAITLLNV